MPIAELHGLKMFHASQYLVNEKVQNTRLLSSKCTTSHSHLPKNYGLVGLPEVSLNLKMQYSVPFLLVVVYEKVQRSPTYPASVQQAFLIGEKMCNDAPCGLFVVNTSSVCMIIIACTLRTYHCNVEFGGPLSTRPLYTPQGSPVGNANTTRVFFHDVAAACLLYVHRKLQTGKPVKVGPVGPKIA